MDKDLIDSIKKLTVSTTKLTIAIQGLLTWIEENKKNGLNFDFRPSPVAVDQGPRKPDRYDRANLDFDLKYGLPNGRSAPKHQAAMDDAEAARLAQAEIDSRSGS